MTGGRFSVRATTTLAATAVVAVILAAAGAALVLLVRQELVAGVDALAQDRALEIAVLQDDLATTPGAVPPVPYGGSLVQVLDGRGHVITASEGLRIGPMARPVEEPQIRTRTLPVTPTRQYRVLAMPAGTAEAPRTIVVAQSLRGANRAVWDTARMVAAIFPAVLVLTGLVTWLSVGRALAPVEQIRRKAATIGAGDLSQRVPLPPARDELYRLAETMNSMLARIQATTERRRHFVSDASHELRTPLANMQAMLEVAVARDDPELWHETAAALRIEQSRMARLVEDLLLLARLDGRVPRVDREVDLDDVVHDEAQWLRRTTALRVEVEPLPALRVLGDPSQLTRVLRNLTDNARRHARTTIWLSLRQVGGSAVVTVRDDGAGIAEKDRERVFDRFTRLDEARGRDQGGSGLGLAISREIARAHGGELLVADATGPGGAVLELRLPLLAEGSGTAFDDERHASLR